MTFVHSSFDLNGLQILGCPDKKMYIQQQHTTILPVIIQLTSKHHLAVLDKVYAEELIGLC
jgi:hypothetical protein